MDDLLVLHVVSVAYNYKVVHHEVQTINFGIVESCIGLAEDPFCIRNLLKMLPCSENICPSLMVSWFKQVVGKSF